MIEPEQHHYGSVAALFHSPYLALMIRAMAAGNSPALMWVNDTSAPRSVCIWDGSHCVYFAGALETPVESGAIRRLVETTLLPQARARDVGILKLYYEGEAWKDALEPLFGGVPLIHRSRVFYALDPATETAPPDVLPAGASIRPIDGDLLTSDAFKNAEMVLDEIGSCWTSLQRFLENGFGFCLVVNGDEIACWCTAEYVSPNQCGIGIETVEAYMNRGYATHTARAFVRHCRAHGITPHWDSWEQNLPSVRVARNVGFQNPLHYSIAIYPFDAT